MKKTIIIILLVIAVPGSYFAYKSFSTPKTLYAAMKAHDKKGFEALLNAGADPNVSMTLTGPRGDKYTETVMRFAAESEDNYYLRLLLQHGGNPNARNNLGFPILFDTTHTPSDYWAKNHTNVLWDNFDLLVVKGADVNAIGRGDNILTYLATTNFFTDVEKILNQYPNIDYKDKPTLRASLAYLVQTSVAGPSTDQGKAKDRVKTWLQNYGINFPVPKTEYHPNHI